MGLFEIIGLIVFLVVAVICAMLAFDYYHYKSVKHAGNRIKLSEPSQHIIKEFKQIPTEHRPYAVENLYGALIALDTKVSRDEANRHFRHSGYETSYFAWKDHGYGSCGHGHCEFQQYWGLHLEIEKLKEEIENREHVLAVAGVQANLDRVNELTESIRNERRILSEVTKELV